MTNAELNIERALGVWAEDPRSLQGAMALGLHNRNVSYASTKYGDLDDPRVVATKAEVTYRHSPQGHLEAVTNPTHIQKEMQIGVEYSL